MTTNGVIRNLTMPVLGVMLGLLALTAGRTLAESDVSSSNPPIGALRTAPNVNAMPAAPRLDPAELAASADAVGVVHVTSVETVVDVEWTSEMTGLTNRWGRGVVTATVERAIVGNVAELSHFSFSAIFVPGTMDVAVPVSAPPLEVGRDYLVFVKDGAVYFPGGTYGIHDGRVWDVGQWNGPESRTYPDDLSGLTIDAASQQISDNR